MAFKKRIIEQKTEFLVVTVALLVGLGVLAWGVSGTWPPWS